MAFEMQVDCWSYMMFSDRVQETYVVRIQNDNNIDMEAATPEEGQNAQ